MNRQRTNTCMAYHRKNWRVTVRKANYSTFNGGHRTPSAYSEVHCIECGRTWRTKAAYVDTLRSYNG